MDALHARYPFLEAAREAVRTADVDLGDLVRAGDHPVVERALDRVRCAITDGSVGDPHPTTRVELLSYPVARVLVSLVDQAGLPRRYAHAEAETAVTRIRDDVEHAVELRSVTRDPLTLAGVLEEFDLEADVRPDGDGFRVRVGTYLSLAADRDAERWRLVHRDLAGGEVPVTRGEFFELLRTVIRNRVEADLPLDVPDAVADALADPMASLRAHLADVDLSRRIDTVVPGLFPPCMRALLDAARSGEDLAAHSRFALVSFLAGVGMTPDEIERLCDAEDGDGVRYAADHVADDGVAVYPPPSCGGMVTYGDCVNPDDLCDSIAHPLEYYGERLDRAGETRDWRETGAYSSRPESQ